MDKEALLTEFRAPLLQLPQIAQNFDTTFHDLALTSPWQCLPTPITTLPGGQETGAFLAIDIGGTNLRVGIVTLFGRDNEEEGGRFRINSQNSWNIPDHFKHGVADQLFEWIAQRIAEGVAEYIGTVGSLEAERLCSEGLKMGVTFSFPMEQSSHDSALLMHTGKGFHFSGTNDLVMLLMTAYTPLCTGVPIRIVAITNDSVATLLSTAYIHHDAHKRAAAGIIAGTGTNATCLCPTSKLSQHKRRGDSRRTILINTEWGINGTSAPLAPFVTAADRVLDASNEHPGFMPFEEMVGGRYIGEVVRLAFEQLGTEDMPALLRTPYAVGTKLCSEVEAAASVEEAQKLLMAAAAVTDDYDAEFWTLERVLTFREIAAAVSERAAALVAAATVGVLSINNELKTDGTTVMVGWTGTLLEKYWGFRVRCQGFLDMLTQGRAQLVEARDGGIVGAAVLAAMVTAGVT